MSDTVVDEKVKVWAFFDDSLPSVGNSPIFPIAMNWRRRFVKFQKLVFASSRSIGNEKIIKLVCASDSANFELEFNNSSYLWRLKKVMSHE
jgi:hypothetical protein